MNISPRNSMTIGQLAQLYNSNPNVDPSEVGSNIFLGSSQGADYLAGQGRDLGIGDPATYFQQARDAQRAASVQSGGTAEALHLAGIFSLQSLPGQLAAHQQQIGQIEAQQSQQSQVAGLQQQQLLDRQYPLPTPGVTPTLSPVMQTAMQQQGLSDPAAFLMQQRLGNNRSSVIPFSSVSGGQVKPEDLYHEPTFQANMNQNPAKASQIFGALTGGDLGTFHTNYLKSQADMQKVRDTELQKGLADGTITVDAQGNTQFSEKVFDPTTNRMVPTGKFKEGTPYQKIIGNSLSRVAPEIDRFHQLAAKGGPTPVGITALQEGDNTVPAGLDASSIWGTGFTGTAAQATEGMLADAGRIFSGQSQSFAGAANPQDFNAPTGSAIRHAAPLLRNNPQFQQLMRTNPAKARALIMAIQGGM